MSGHTEVERLIDLLERAKRAEKDIKSLARSVSRSAHGAVERHRLNGKAEGVGLAISYIREALHDAEQFEGAPR